MILISPLFHLYASKGSLYFYVYSKNKKIICTKLNIILTENFDVEYCKTGKFNLALTFFQTPCLYRLFHGSHIEPPIGPIWRVYSAHIVNADMVKCSTKLVRCVYFVQSVQCSAVQCSAVQCCICVSCVTNVWPLHGRSSDMATRHGARHESQHRGNIYTK